MIYVAVQVCSTKEGGGRPVLRPPPLRERPFRTSFHPFLELLDALTVKKSTVKYLLLSREVWTKIRILRGYFGKKKYQMLNMGLVMTFAFFSGSTSRLFRGAREAKGGVRGLL